MISSYGLTKTYKMDFSSDYRQIIDNFKYFSVSCHYVSHCERQVSYAANTRVTDRGDRPL